MEPWNLVQREKLLMQALYAEGHPSGEKTLTQSEVKAECEHCPTVPSPLPTTTSSLSAHPKLPSSIYLHRESHQGQILNFERSPRQFQETFQGQMNSISNEPTSLRKLTEHTDFLNQSALENPVLSVQDSCGNVFSMGPSTNQQRMFTQFQNQSVFQNCINVQPMHTAFLKEIACEKPIQTVQDHCAISNALIEHRFIDTGIEVSLSQRETTGSELTPVVDLNLQQNVVGNPIQTVQYRFGNDISDAKNELMTMGREEQTLHQRNVISTESIPMVDSERRRNQYSNHEISQETNLESRLETILNHNDLATITSQHVETVSKTETDFELEIDKAEEPMVVDNPQHIKTSTLSISSGDNKMIEESKYQEDSRNCDFLDQNAEQTEHSTSHTLSEERTLDNDFREVKISTDQEFKAIDVAIDLIQSFAYTVQNEIKSNNCVQNMTESTDNDFTGKVRQNENVSHEGCNVLEERSQKCVQSTMEKVLPVSVNQNICYGGDSSTLSNEAISSLREKESSGQDVRGKLRPRKHVSYNESTEEEKQFQEFNSTNQRVFPNSTNHSISDREHSSSLSNDQYSKDEEGRYICNICRRSFSRKHDLFRHKRNIHDNNYNRRVFTYYTCDICGKKFDKSDALEEHKKIEERNWQSECREFCGKLFTSKECMESHVKCIHSDGNPNSSEVSSHHVLSQMKGPPSTISISSTQRKQSERNKTYCSTKIVSGKKILCCNICDTQFESFKDRHVHMTETHKLKKPYHCELCPAQFNVFKHLLDHERNLHSQEVAAGFFNHNQPISRVCDVCGAVYTDAHQFNRHVISCKGNSESFASKNTIQQDIFICDMCGWEFSQRLALVEHKTRAHGTDCFHKCELCGETFDKSRKLQRHKSLMQCVKKGENQRKEEEDAVHHCATCGRHFVDRVSLQIHINRQHEKPKGVYSCVFCNKHVKTKVSIVRHLISHLGLKQYECSKCGRRFDHKRRLTVHDELMHLQSSWHICDVCGMSFLRKDKFIDHKRRAHKIKHVYTCDLCGKSFDFSAALKKHKKMEESKVQHKHCCEFCGKLYAGKENMKYHIKSIHFKEKPFSCEICHKTFISKSALAFHTKRHKGIKKFHCETCNRSFYSLFLLRKHMTSFHLRVKESFQCPVCGYVFHHAAALYRHRVVHSGEKPYKCDICGLKVTQNSALARHKKLHLKKLEKV